MAAFDNALGPPAKGIVSTLNSSTALLGIGGVYTGTPEFVADFATITVSAFSDQASAVDGLSIQQSMNGSSWDLGDVYSVPAATGKTFMVPTQGAWYRTVYTNGGVGQGTFRLQTLFHRNAKKGSSIRPQDARSNDNDMEETVSYLAGFNGTTWDRLRSTITNGLAVFNAQVGLTTDAAATTDTGTFTQISLIKRLLGKFPALLGSATSAASFPVVIASDQVAVPVTVAAVTQTGSITAQNTNPTGTATAGSAVAITVAPGMGILTIGVQGVWTSAITMQLWATLDNVLWTQVTGTSLLRSDGTYTASITSAAVGLWQTDCSGYLAMRVTSGNNAWTGTANITLRCSAVAGMVSLGAQLPAGVNAIGSVTIGNGSSTIPVIAATVQTLHKASGANVNNTLVNGASTTLLSIAASNNSASIRYLKLYNKSTAPVAGTDVIELLIAIPALASGTPVNFYFGSQGHVFNFGLGLAITGAAADADTTITAANEIKLLLTYR